MTDVLEAKAKINEFKEKHKTIDKEAKEFSPEVFSGEEFMTLMKAVSNNTEDTGALCNTHCHNHCRQHQQH